MNEFLKSRKQIDEATKFLQEKGYVESGISCKNWEIKNVIEYMMDGDWLDMGADGSVVLPNLLKKIITGKKYGIDLAYPENVESPAGYTLVKGDLMNTPFEDGSFDFITSLSVIEHDVDFDLFAKEVYRLLRSGGKVYLSFDYWPTPIDTSKTKLYSLDWKILSHIDVLKLIESFYVVGFVREGSDIDWTTQDAVITPQYCSPAKDVSYTFGILSFNKK